MGQASSGQQQKQQAALLPAEAGKGKWEVDPEDVDGPITAKQRRVAFAPLLSGFNCHFLWWFVFMALLCLIAAWLICDIIELTSTAKSADSEIKDEFDCKTGLENWENEWSESQKEWCSRQGYVSWNGGGYSICPDAVWDEWTDWGDCSSTCSPSWESRKRSLTDAGSCLSDKVAGDEEMEEKICHDLPVCEGMTWRTYDVVIGPSLDDDTKCVDNPHADDDHHVVCDDTSEQHVGEHSDKFRVYHDGGSICATRIDYPDPWSANLILSCKVAAENGVIESDDEYTLVHIGNSLAERNNSKCVTAPPDVHCDEHTEAQGMGSFPDQFRIMHNGPKICAYREDSKDPWGLNLVLKCKTEPGYHEMSSSENGYTEITVGDTLKEKTNIKCVDDPGNVDCDEHAEQVGRTGKWPDKFDIYHENGKICARRTDSESPWGLNLVLKCKNK